MKVASIALALLSLPASIWGCSLSGMTLTGTCSFDNIISSGSCSEGDLTNLLGSNARQLVENACQVARSQAHADFLPWESVTKRGYQFDKEFFNGGSIFNTETSSDSFGYDTQRLQLIKDNLLKKHGIGWPYNIDNFDEEEACNARAAMCCWVASRKDGAPDAEPANNTDVCSVDMSNSPTSAHIRAGINVFPGDAEGAVNCHGFHWDDSAASSYKGNLLFHVAMEFGLLNNGYVRNVPGAPMCGCVEQMPVVSTANCTSMSVSETFEIEYSAEKSITINVAGDPSISFGACSGDGTLESAYQTDTQEGNLDEYIVGDCDSKEEEILTSEAFAPQTEEWVPVAGKGLSWYPSAIPSEFRQIWAKSPNQILRRRCVECDYTHKDVYYRRYDDPESGLPANLDLLHIMKNYWYDITGNKFHQDFEIYSSYRDALNNTNPWAYCNFNNNIIGFPLECGPVTRVTNQWNAFEPVHGHHHGQYHVAYYVEGENNPAGKSRTTAAGA